MFGANPILIFKHGGGCIMVWVCLTLANTGEFFRIKINWMELSTGKILEENQSLEEEFTFQHANTKPNISVG
jgi:hypothetical protein